VRKRIDENSGTSFVSWDPQFSRRLFKFTCRSRDNIEQVSKIKAYVESVPTDLKKSFSIPFQYYIKKDHTINP